MLASNVSILFMLHFAVAGVPLASPKPGTCEGLKYARSIGIAAMELEWVQQVPKNAERMDEIRKCCEELGGMSLTVHAPYYINLNSPKQEIYDSSIRRILNALSMAQLAGAKSVCVHAAFYMGKDSADVTDTIKKATELILKSKKKFFPDVNLGYETMGKPGQWGTLEEVLEVSKEFGLYPTLDASHLHARYNGKINSTAEFEEMFDTYQSYLGKDSLQQMHLHYSGIAYTEKGERKHLPFPESDAKWKDYLKVLKKRKIGGQLVVESPLLEEETLLLMKAYEKI